MTPRLHTNPLSPDCETARWALDRRGIAYIETCHLPTLQGGQRTPVLRMTEQGQPHTLTDATAILQFADRVGRPGDLLFPDSAIAADVAADVVALTARLDHHLGPHARRLALFFLLDDAPAMQALIATAPVPGSQRAQATATLRLVTLMLRRSVDVGAAAVGRSRAEVEAICGEVEKRLADGRRFLTGDAFTAADLTFAALMAPLVVPTAYQERFVPLSATGAPWRRAIDGWRATRAGKFAMTLFAQHRDPSMSDR